MMMNELMWRHWQLVRDTQAIAWLTLDCADASTNTLGGVVIEELAQIIALLEADRPKALIIRSGKKAGFIAGADVEEFTRLAGGAAVRAMVQRSWRLFERIEALPFPTLALIRGHCMGGGLELALACRHRLAVDEPGTRMALPEVMLGIVPGWGGMLRLPRLIGPAAALDMMLTGKQIDARRGKRMGLVDECVPPRVADNAARMLVMAGQARRKNGLVQSLLNGPLKGMVARRARAQVAAKASPEHYPAPYAIIDTWQNFGGDSLKVPPGHPSSFEHILQQGTAKNLLRVFFLQQRLKALGKVDDMPAVRHVHVVGAGVMGGDIAAWCVLRGMTVTLQDQTIERIAPAVKRAAESFAKKFRGERREIRFALDRLIADPRGDGVAHADVVIEAIYENLEAKHALFRDIEKRARPDALLASNTSSLRLEDIATVLCDPQRLVGIHFFNPVAMMPLVEVVRSETGTDVQIARAMGFVHQLDKLPLPVKSAPGFLVNAVLGPYLLEAMRCVEEGMAPTLVDTVAVAFGMPMGPIELADTVGLDVALATGKALTGSDLVPAQLARHVEAGELGRKSGQGYYRWHEGKAIKSAGGLAPAGLAGRLIAPLLQATRRCVEQGVVADADLADAGIIFGTGFAPWTGGPMHHQSGLNRQEDGS